MCLAIPGPAMIQLRGVGGGELALLSGGEEGACGVWCFGSLQSSSKVPKNTQILWQLTRTITFEVRLEALWRNSWGR